MFPQFCLLKSLIYVLNAQILFISLYHCNFLGGKKEETVIYFQILHLWNKYILLKLISYSPSGCGQHRSWSWHSWVLWLGRDFFNESVSQASIFFCNLMFVYGDRIHKNTVSQSGFLEAFFKHHLLNYASQTELTIEWSPSHLKQLIKLVCPWTHYVILKCNQL